MNPFYQNPTSFGFGGSDSGVLPSTLDSINPAYYDQIKQFIASKGGRLASIYGVCLYDTYRFDAGVLPATTLGFFQNGVGSTQALVSAGTNYKKQQIDVSPWIRNGALGKGYEALIWSIGVQIHTTAAQDETVQTSGNAINLTNDPGTIAGEDAGHPTRQANVMRAFQEGLYAEFSVNQTPFEHGPLWRFPAGVYGTGGGIALGGVVANPIADGALSNGFGWEYQMPVMRHLPELTNFAVNLAIQNQFNLTNAGPVRVVVTLGGIGIGPVTG